MGSKLEDVVKERLYRAKDRREGKRDILLCAPQKPRFLSPYTRVNQTPMIHRNDLARGKLEKCTPLFGY